MSRVTKTRVDKHTGKNLRAGEYAKSATRYEYRYYDERGVKVSVWAKSLSELRRKERAIETGNNKPRAARTKTVDDVYDDFTADKLAQRISAGLLRHSTADYYERIYSDYIRGTKLGKTRISKVTRAHVEAFYLELLARGLSARTIQTVQSRLRQCLDYAVERGYCESNVSIGVATSIAKQAANAQQARDGKLVRCLTPDQRDILLDVITYNERFWHYAPIIRFLLHTGIRAGELAGLRPCDIDGDALHIQRTLAYRREHDTGEYAYVINPPKTAASNRTFKLTRAAQKDLKDWYDVGERAESTCGVDDFIFSSQLYHNSVGGKPLTHGTLGHILKAAARVANEKYGADTIPESISPHWLRHTFICDAIDAGVPATAVAALVGHETETITMRVYYECRPHVIDDAVDVLDEVFDGDVASVHLVA